MTTKHYSSTRNQLSAELLAALQSRRTNKKMLEAAKDLGLVNSDRRTLLNDAEWNLTMEEIDQSHPGWRDYGAKVARFHDVYEQGTA